MTQKNPENNMTIDPSFGKIKKGDSGRDKVLSDKSSKNGSNVSVFSAKQILKELDRDSKKKITF